MFSRLDRGGAELRTIELAKELKRHNIFFDYLCISGKKGVLDDEVLKNGSRIFYVQLKSPFFYKRFSKILQKEKYNVIHSHIFLASGLIHLIGKAKKVPVRISHFRSTSSGNIETFLSKVKNFMLLKLVLMYSTKIVCVSKSVKTSLFNENERKKYNVDVIYNGFPESTLYRKKVKKEHYIIHVGRMIPDKNHLTLLKVYKELISINNSYKLILVGKINNEIKQELDKFIIKHSLSNNIKFLGERNDVNYLLKKSSILIYPSKREGLPGVVIESLINGTPVLASNIPPIKEVSNFFSQIKCLDLKQDHKEWAINALDIINKNESSILDEESLVDSFKKSPFSMEKNIEQVIALYK